VIPGSERRWHPECGHFPAGRERPEYDHAAVGAEASVRATGEKRDVHHGLLGPARIANSFIDVIQ